MESLFYDLNSLEFLWNLTSTCFRINFCSMYRLFNCSNIASNVYFPLCMEAMVPVNIVMYSVLSENDKPELVWQDKHAWVPNAYLLIHVSLKVINHKSAIPIAGICLVLPARPGFIKAYHSTLFLSFQTHERSVMTGKTIKLEVNDTHASRYIWDGMNITKRKTIAIIFEKYKYIKWSGCNIHLCKLAISSALYFSA